MWNRNTEARASLLDRLVDDEPDAAAELRLRRVLTRDELMESVRSELARLLNTRLGPMRNAGARTVLEYGVVDYTAFYPANQENRRRLARMMEASIETFEPRLRSPRVQVDAAPEQHGLVVRIEGILVSESVREPVSFPIAIRHRDAPIEVNIDE